MEPTLVRAPGRWAAITVLLVGLALIAVALAAPLAFADAAETTLTLGAAPTTINWAQPWALTGELTSGGAAVPDAQVNLQSSLDGGDTWATLQTETPAAGTSTYTDSIVGTYQKMQYRLFYEGADAYEASYSDPVTITPRVKLGTPVAPASVTAGAKFTAYGSLKPTMAKGSKTVKIKCYLKQSGSWVLKKTVQATNAQQSSSAMRYSAKFSLSKGSWKLVAYSPSTAKYAKTTSGNEMLKAK